MDLIIINKELVRIADSLGIKTVDDAEFLQANVLWVEQLYKSQTQGNKLNNDKESFFLGLNLYELDSHKAALYQSAKSFIEKMMTDFKIEGYTVKIEKRKEELKKVSADTGKLYQYSFTLIITTYKTKSL